MTDTVVLPWSVSNSATLCAQDLDLELNLGDLDITSEDYNFEDVGGEVV